MTKRVLFILPSIWAGGTHASLSSIIAHYNRQLWDVSVFAITGFGERNSSYKPFLLPRNKMMAALFCHQSEIKGFYIRLVKGLGKLLALTGINLKELVTKKVVKNLESMGFDTVVGFMEGSATHMASMFNRSRKVAWIHCNYDKYLPDGKSEEGIYSKFDSIICVSKYTSSVFKHRYPSLANRTDFIYNLLDTERIVRLSNADIDDSRFFKDGITILSVGRIAKVKRFSSIPRMASELKKEGIPFRWYLIGPDFDTTETTRLLHEIAEYNVADCFSWLGGKLNPSPYFKAADIYVCLSESEACPMVFNEARIFGSPIVSTDFPSSFEFIENGYDGIISDFDNLVHALSRLMKDPILFAEMRQNSLSRVFDNESIMRKIEQII